MTTALPIDAIVVCAVLLLPGGGERAEAAAPGKTIVHGCSKRLPGSRGVTGKAILRPGGRACESEASGEPLRVLVYSRTTGFRHPSIEDAKAFFTDLPAREGIVAALTEDPADFTDEALAAFDVVAFVNTTGEILDDAQQAALERFVQSGRGWVGVHSAADTPRRTRSTCAARSCA